MMKRVWTIGTVALMVVSVVTLFAIRPELADNPNIWAVLIPAIPSLIAMFKAEEASKKTEEGNEQIAVVRQELKNGTITKVVQDAMVGVMEDNGVQLTENGEGHDDAR